MLDPQDWDAFRAQAHRILDDAIDYLAQIDDGPVWQEPPPRTLALPDEPFPEEPTPLERVYDRFARDVMPYHGGNIHPRFLGWVQGTGTPTGAIADFLAATMNANVGGRNHASVYVERQVIRWFCTLFGFGSQASGIVLTGTSAANFVATLVARTRALGVDVRARGVREGDDVVGYASAATHSSLQRAFEMAGLGSDALRSIPFDAQHRIRIDALRTAIAADTAAGRRPFLVVGTAGTVDVGAIDPLETLSEIARETGAWFHVDGAFGASAYLSPARRAAFRGIERADSLAFDFHKWLQVPFDAACVLVRDATTHRQTFASAGAYLTRSSRGVAAGTPWFTDFGPELSRGFRALKVWFTIQEHGMRRLAEAIERNCELAQRFSHLLAENGFAIVAPVTLNVVCFRPDIAGADGPALDRIVDEAMILMQERGVAVIAGTAIDGRRAMRACFVNHRTRDDDLPIVVNALREAVRDAHDAIRATIA